MKSYTIAFDLDNCLCTSIRKGHPEDIMKVKPRNKLVKIVKELKERGHFIVIFTRRDVLDDGHLLTKKWLEKHNVPYDKLITDKPHYDILIDDRAMSSHFNFVTPEIIENGAEFIHRDIKKHTYRPSNWGRR